jgi:hypothetical protein
MSQEGDMRNKGYDLFYQKIGDEYETPIEHN